MLPFCFQTQRDCWIGRGGTMSTGTSSLQYVPRAARIPFLTSSVPQAQVSTPVQSPPVSEVAHVTLRSLLGSCPTAPGCVCNAAIALLLSAYRALYVTWLVQYFFGPPLEASTQDQHIQAQGLAGKCQETPRDVDRQVVLRGGHEGACQSMNDQNSQQRTQMV